MADDEATEDEMSEEVPSPPDEANLLRFLASLILFARNDANLDSNE